MRFEGKVALVTGAGSGIGKATVDQFIAGGARVIAVDVVEGTLQAALSEWQAAGGQVTGVVANVMEEADVDRMIETAHATYGRLDILCNNAGIMDMMTPAADLIGLSPAASRRDFNPCGEAVGGVRHASCVHCRVLPVVREEVGQDILHRTKHLLLRGSVECRSHG